MISLILFAPGLAYRGTYRGNLKILYPYRYRMNKNISLGQTNLEMWFIYWNQEFNRIYNVKKID